MDSVLSSRGCWIVSPLRLWKDSAGKAAVKQAVTDFRFFIYFLKHEPGLGTNEMLSRSGASVSREKAAGNDGAVCFSCMEVTWVPGCPASDTSCDSRSSYRATGMSLRRPGVPWPRVGTWGGTWGVGGEISADGLDRKSCSV